MANKKFNIGDCVIVEESNIEGICGVNLRGKNVVGTIERIFSDAKSAHPYWVITKEHPGGLYCSVKCLASEFNKEKIVITHDGKTVKATMYYGDGSKEMATANCSPEDTFDFYTGAKLAMERLMNKVAKDTPIVVKGFKVGDRVRVAGMNGTIICITTTDMFGVQFEDEQFSGHRCGGVKLKAGSPSSKRNCWWVKANNMSKTSK